MRTITPRTLKVVQVRVNRMCTRISFSFRKRSGKSEDFFLPLSKHSWNESITSSADGRLTRHRESVSSGGSRIWVTGVGGGGGGGILRPKNLWSHSDHGEGLPSPPLGGPGHAPPGNFENCDAQIRIFHYFGVSFQKNQRANLQGNLYIYLQFLQNIWSHREDQEDQEEDVQHEENHASNGRPSNILLGCLCPYAVTTSSKSKCMSLWTYRRSSAFKRPSNIVLRWSDLTNPRAIFFFGRQGGGGRPRGSATGFRDPAALRKVWFSTA